MAKRKLAAQPERQEAAADLEEEDDLVDPAAPFDREVVSRHVDAAWRELGGRKLGPGGWRYFAEVLLAEAEEHARRAYAEADRLGVELEVNVDDPAPLRVERDWALGGPSNPIDRAVALARRDLGVPADPSTAELLAAAARLKKAGGDPRRPAISRAMEGARAAADSAARYPEMRSVAWLLSAAAYFGMSAVAHRDGVADFGGRASFETHPWVRAVERVKAAGVGAREALARLLAAHDQRDTHGRNRAEWETLFERVEAAVKVAGTRRRK